MRLGYFIILLLFFLAQHAVAQKDTSTIKGLIEKAVLLRESNPDSSLLLNKQALNLSKRIKYRNGIAQSLLGIGRYYAFVNNLQQSLHYLRESLLYADNRFISSHENTVLTYILMSENFYYMGQYDSCAYYRYEALNTLEEYNIQNPAMEMRVYGKLLQFWINAHEGIRNDPYTYQLFLKINKLEQVALANKDSSLLIQVYFQKAAYYNNTGNNDSSRYYCNRILQIGELIDMAVSMKMATLTNTATTYIEDKQPEMAITVFNKVIQMASKENSVTYRYAIFSHILLGEAYLQLKQYKKAINTIEPFLIEAERLNIVTITDRGHKTLADAYEAIGVFKKAAEHRKKFLTIKDSLSKTEKMELVYNIEMKYRIVEKNKELAQKELSIALSENKLKTKNIWIVCISSLLLLLSLLILLIYRNNKHKQRIQTEKIFAMQKDMEINRLKAMISGEEKERSRLARELHDGIGGTLGSIRGQLSMLFRKHKQEDVTNDFIEIMSLLEDASAELRKTSHNLMPEILLQEGLTKATALFCERVSKGNIIAVNFETWGEMRALPEETELAIYRIVQELIHNVIKHSEATEANVQFVFHEKQLCLTVEDNGKGMTTEQQQTANGIGIKTIKERVNSLNGQLDIDSAPGKGTSIYIEFNIPAKQNIEQKWLSN